MINPYLSDLDLGRKAGDLLPSSRSMRPGLESLEEKCLNIIKIKNLEQKLNHKSCKK